MLQQHCIHYCQCRRHPELQQHFLGATLANLVVAETRRSFRGWMAAGHAAQQAFSHHQPRIGPQRNPCRAEELTPTHRSGLHCQDLPQSAQLSADPLMYIILLCDQEIQ